LGGIALGCHMAKLKYRIRATSVDDARVGPSGRFGPRQIVVISAQADFGARCHISEDFIRIPQDRERPATAGENDSIVASRDNYILSRTIADELTAAIAEHNGFSDGDLTRNCKTDQSE
jgi:hypothetical protein